MSKRAVTAKMKRAVIERILVAWEQVPDQRLGQLIDNAHGQHEMDLFQVEDFDLAERVERFADDSAKRRPPG